MSIGLILLFTGLLLAAGLAVSLLAGRLRVPGLVLVLGLGMALGSDGLGWIAFDDYELARKIGVVALGLILFEGGLAAGWSEIRPVLGPAVSLAVVGTIATALIAGGGGRMAVRSAADAGSAARLDPRVDGRRGRVRGPTRVDAAPASGSHA